MPRFAALNLVMTGVAIQLDDSRCDSLILESPSTNSAVITILETGTAVIVAVLGPGGLANSRVEIKGMRNTNEFDANGTAVDVLIIRRFLT